MGLLINLSEDAEGRTWHSCTVGASWVCVSSVFESWSSGRRGWAALCFFFPVERENKTKQKNRLAGASAGSHRALLFVMADLSHSWKVQNFTYWGSCHSISRRGRQHFWQGVQRSLTVESSRRLMNVGGKYVAAARFLSVIMIFIEGDGDSLCQYLHTTLN